MLARVPVILFGVPAVYGLLVAGGDLVRLAFFTLIAIGGQFELIKMFNSDFKYTPIIEAFCGIGILVSANYYGERGLLLAFSFSAIILMVSTVLRGLQGNGYKRFCLGFLSILYLPFCISFFLLLGLSKGGLILFCILASVWTLDIGAYLFGMSIRGPKLAPKISPNKTISGAIGGAITSILFLLVMNKYNFLVLPNNRLIIILLSIPFIGQIGDLFESILKREADVKDSGTLLGAHGGILDRIDSILFLGPICYAIVAI